MIKIPKFQKKLPFKASDFHYQNNGQEKTKKFCIFQLMKNMVNRNLMIWN